MAKRELTESEKEQLSKVVGKYKRHRALLAILASRPIGIRGQPPYLTEKEDNDLELLLLQQELHGVLYSYSGIEELV
jgi:hypothetical protein